MVPAALSLALLLPAFPSAAAEPNQLARSAAEAVRASFSALELPLIEASRSPVLSGTDAAAKRAALNRLLQENPAYLEVSLFDLDGQEILRSARFLEEPAPGAPNLRGQTPFEEALRGGNYIGAAETYRGIYPVTVFARAVLEERPPDPPARRGVLLAKVSLAGLSEMLQQRFPAREGFAAGVTVGKRKDVTLIAHSDPAHVYRIGGKPPFELQKELCAVLATAPVEETGWTVFIAPAGLPRRAPGPTTSNMGWLTGALGLVAVVLRAAGKSLRPEPPLQGKISYPSFAGPKPDNRPPR